MGVNYFSFCCLFDEASSIIKYYYINNWNLCGVAISPMWRLLKYLSLVSPFYGFSWHRHGLNMNDRIICHFDVDSFYCACECIRRPELKNKPFAVTQYNSGGFVSVNHIARLAGVRKGDGIGAGGQKALEHFKNRPDALMGEVLKRCPDLVVLPMDTIWYRKVSSDIENALKLALKKIFERTVPLSISSPSSSSSSPTHLSSPQTFLRKNKNTNIHSNKHGVVEKSSIDDFFVDITKIVFGYLMHNCDSTTSNKFSDTYNTKYRESCNDFKQCLSIGNATCIYEYDTDGRRLCRVQNRQAFSRLPIHLQYAAEVATQIRSYVEEMIGVTLSGGISKNKLISRLISKIAHRKNVQTLIENKNINYLLKITPIKSVPGLKGQFGNRLVTDFNVESLCDLRKIKFHKLEQMYGKTKANLIYEYSRGIDTSRVAERPPIKSLLSEQSFAPIDNVTQTRLLQRKVKEMVALFIDRLLLLENRIPTNFTVKFRHLYNQVLSKSRPFPKLHLFKNLNRMNINNGNGLYKYESDDRNKDVEKLYSIIYQILSANGNKLKLSRLALVAGSFQEFNTKQKSIVDIFSKASVPKTLDREIFQEPCNTTSLMEHRNGSHYICALCEKTIRVDKKQEHEDFHYALSISKSEERQSQHQLSLQSKKKKRGNGNNDIRKWIVKKKSKHVE